MGRVEDLHKRKGKIEASMADVSRAHSFIGTRFFPRRTDLNLETAEGSEFVDRSEKVERIKSRIRTNTMLGLTAMLNDVDSDLARYHAEQAQEVHERRIGGQMLAIDKADI